MNKKEKCFRYAILLTVFLLILFLFIGLEYRQYRQKLSILYQAVEKEDSGESVFEWATGVVKGTQKLAARKVPAILEEYGYHLDFRDELWKEFLKNSIFLGLGMGVLAAGSIVTEAFWQKRRRQREAWKTEELQRRINLLREGRYQEAGDILSWDCEKENNLSELYMDMASLAEHIELVTAQAHTEKEETKTLVTDISHQLKTPVAALKASFDILSKQQLSRAERQEFFERSREQVSRLEELAAALIQISRMETGMIRVNLVPAPVFDTILQAVNRIYPKAEEKNIEICMQESGLPPGFSIVQDKKWLSEALINVLENAVKYSEPGTTVTIGLEKRQTFLRIEIADEGIGIPRSERNQVFKRFYRGTSERVAQEGGSGVGLYLTRKIIDLHYGTVKVMDARGRYGKEGSIFMIQLPCR